MPPGEHAPEHDAHERDGVLETRAVINRLWMLVDHDQSEGYNRKRYW